MLDYVKWMFRLDFCTRRYVITRKFGRDKVRVGWRIRAKRFENRIRNSEVNKIINSEVNKIMLNEKKGQMNGKICTREKEKVSTKGTDGW